MLFVGVIAFTLLYAWLLLHRSRGMWMEDVLDDRGHVFDRGRLAVNPCHFVSLDTNLAATAPSSPATASSGSRTGKMTVARAVTNQTTTVATIQDPVP